MAKSCPTQTTHVLSGSRQYCSYYNTSAAFSLSTHYLFLDEYVPRNCDQMVKTEQPLRWPIIAMGQKAPAGCQCWGVIEMTLGYVASPAYKM